jgi:hypothetical protein
VFAELFEERCQDRSFGDGQRFEYCLQLARMRAENAPDQGSPRWGQRHVGYPAILWASLSADKALFLEAIYCGGDRSAGKHHVSPDRIDGQGTFMQEDFEDGEVRDTKSGSGDTPGIDLRESAVSLHQNQPKMNTGSVSWAGLRVAHRVTFISRYFERKVFLTVRLMPAKDAKKTQKKIEIGMGRRRFVSLNFRVV